MRSHETVAPRERTLQLIGVILARELRVTWLLLAKELRELLVSRALWAMVLISAPLVGFSFIQAVRLYSQSSLSAARLPQLAANLNPLDGIIVPTFGAVYLMNTFLLPFVAIRAIGNEKQTGALKIALQLPIGINRLMAVKLVALMVGWTIALLPTLSALAIWSLVLGGHLSWPELFSVVLGHALYAFVIAGVAFLAASLTESSATAAIVALSFTLGSWILEFAGTTSSGLVRAISAFSLSPALRGLEHGLLGSPTALTLLVLGLGFLALCVVWLPPGVSRRQKLVRSGAVAGVSAQALLLVIQLPIYADVSDNQRNSFNPADMRTLRQMTKELKVTVNLASNDSRLADLDRNVLSKLPRVMPHVSIAYAETSSTSLFGGASGVNYGLVTYTYGSKEGVTRATTAREVLPLIEALDGRTVTADRIRPYPGYPLVAGADAASVWFYGLLPALAIAGWWASQRPPSVPLAVRRRGESPTDALPWLGRTLPRVRRTAIAAGIGLVVIQLVPYGRNHTNLQVAPLTAGPAATVIDRYCPGTFAPGAESTMTLGAFRTQIAGVANNLDGALQALAANNAPAVVGQYAQSTVAYGGVSRELAELYPIRCPRLLADRVQADAAILAPAGVNPVAAGPALAGLRAGLISIADDLDQRIRQASPDSLVGNQNEGNADAPAATGGPVWDSDQTNALATRACAACHSNQPTWRWVTNLAPVSWLVQQSVDAGRAALNFSEWDRPQPAAGAATSSVLQKRMPPAYAAVLDSNLRLSDSDRADLARGLQASLSGPSGYLAADTGPGPRPAAGASMLLATFGSALAALGFFVGRSLRPRARPAVASQYPHARRTLS